MVSSQKRDAKNGSLMRSFRKQNKYTVAQLASMLGIGQASVSRYERGVYTMPQSIVDSLNKKYNVGLKDTNRATWGSYNSKSSSSSKSSKSTSKKARKVETVSSKFKAFRTSSNYSWREFCSKYNMTPAHICRMESGKASYISLKTLKSMISNGVDVVEMFK